MVDLLTILEVGQTWNVSCESVDYMRPQSQGEATRRLFDIAGDKT